MKARYMWIAVLVIVAMTLGACAAPAAAAGPGATPQVVEKVVTQIVTQKVEVVETQVVEKKVVQTQVERSSRRPRRPKPSHSSPGSSTTRATWIPRAMSAWATNTCARRFPQFNKAFEGKWVWDNQFTPWDRAAAKIVAAVQAGAEVPDHHGPPGLPGQ